MSRLLAAAGVRKEYPGATALRGVDFSAAPGAWCTIMGPSGSGKTTLLNILAGLDRPTSGAVWLADRELGPLGEDERARLRRENVGLVFQQPHLLPYLDAVENVMLAQYLHSSTDEAEAAEALRRVGMGDRLRHRPGMMSGGEQQRVAVARALVNAPRILLADEPTGNLDLENTKQVLDLFRRLLAGSGIAVVMVTHDPEVAKRSDRIVTLEDGRIANDVHVGR